MSSPSAAPPPRKALSTSPSSESSSTRASPPSPPLLPTFNLPPPIARLAPVDRLLGTLLLLRARRVDLIFPAGDDSATFHLTPAELVKVESQVRKDDERWAWYEGKVRYDWEPEAGRYWLRMPGRVHEAFTASVSRLIGDEIAALALKLADSEDEGEQRVGEALKQVYAGGSPTLELRAPRLENSSQETSAGEGGEVVVIRRSPDATFFPSHTARLPCLVVEVSYSQTRKTLPRLAEGYVVDSRHEIRCVVGLDIPYKGKKAEKGGSKQEGYTATVSVWRPGTVRDDDDSEEVGICRCDIDAVPFRNSPTQPRDSALELTIADFLPSETLDSLPTNAIGENVSISFAALAALLTTAEQPSSASPTQPLFAKAPTRFRKRKRTPTEQLEAKREEKYLRLEREEREREKAVDRA